MTQDQQQRRVKPYPSVVGEPDERAGLPIQYAEGHEDDPDGLMQQAEVVSSVVEAGARVFLWVMAGLAVAAVVVPVAASFCCKG